MVSSREEGHDKASCCKLVHCEGLGDGGEANEGWRK